jgi:hypothetical protein
MFYKKGIERGFSRGAGGGVWGGVRRGDGMRQQVGTFTEQIQMPRMPECECLGACSILEENGLHTL